MWNFRNLNLDQLDLSSKLTDRNGRIYDCSDSRSVIIVSAKVGEIYRIGNCMF